MQGKAALGGMCKGPLTAGTSLPSSSLMLLSMLATGLLSQSAPTCTSRLAIQPTNTLPHSKLICRVVSQPPNPPRHCPLKTHLQGGELHCSTHGANFVDGGEKTVEAVAERNVLLQA